MKSTTTILPISPTIVSYDKAVIQEIAASEGFDVLSSSSLVGGSINQVYLLKTSEGPKVAKINDSERFPGMFAAEKAGLEELLKSETFDVPKVLGAGEVGASAYLLLEHKNSTSQKSHFWKVFAENLATLHKCHRSTFGFDQDNYIGSLPQYNNSHESAARFFISERLKPQFAIASKKGFSFDDLDSFYQNISEEIPEEPASLIHGDLWSGNFLANEEGLPCLIDPAVAYAPREMDLAMMKLFGGFPEEVFQEYEQIFPIQSGSEVRIQIWQLYYLLVHLNIFGSSYLPAVERIVKRFS